MENLKYPIGHFQKTEAIGPEHIEQWTADIESLPARLRVLVGELTDEQLDQPYRPGGWTIRQLVHHLADSHINSHMRFRLMLTEENPTIRPYFEQRWAELPEAKTDPIESSLQILEGVHRRWASLLRNLKPEDYGRTLFHPEHDRSFRLDENIGVYAFHGNHHLAHIKNALAK